MSTSKPISTISYNSESFLKEKLDGWVAAHIIQCYQYIKHKGEDGDKEHIHLRIEPNKKLDVMTLQEELREYVLGEDKPRVCRPFRPSKEEDWFLYAVHDKQYLSLKYGGGEKGEKLPYTWKDIIVSEYYDCEIAFIRAKAYLDHTSANMAERLSSGENPLSLIKQGENVYTVNAIMRSLAVNDYQRLLSKYDDLYSEFEALKIAICNAGFMVVTDDLGNKLLKERSN